MDPIASIFDRMDAWRHLPNYQLERRADLLFSLYIPEAIETKLGFPIRPDLIPEFPVRIGTIYPDVPINKSFKIDYLALSEDGTRAVFVELKTEGLSRREGQDKYLAASRAAGLPALLDGLLTIFRATNAKRKYFRLLEHLARLGLLRLPEDMRDIINGDSLRGIVELSHQIQITCPVSEHHIIYLQPQGSAPGVISFEEFRSVVEAHDDPISQRFAMSLGEWASTPAGTARPS